MWHWQWFEPELLAWHQPPARRLHRLPVIDSPRRWNPHVQECPKRKKTCDILHRFLDLKGNALMKLVLTIQENYWNHVAVGQVNDFNGLGWMTLHRNWRVDSNTWSFHRVRVISLQMFLTRLKFLNWEDQKTRILTHLFDHMSTGTVQWIKSIESMNSKSGTVHSFLFCNKNAPGTWRNIS